MSQTVSFHPAVLLARTIPDTFISPIELYHKAWEVSERHTS